jgi:acetyl-CoA synthase
MFDVNAIFTAATSTDEAEVRQQGIGFIDGSLAGYVLLMGDDTTGVTQLLSQLREKQIVVFVVEDVLRESLQAVGIPLGWEAHTIPTSMIDALGFITRVAQVFGNSDDTAATLQYTRERLRGFTILLGEATSARLAMAQAASLLGCPMVSDTDLPSSVDDWEINADYRPATGSVDPANIIQIGIEERGLQIRIPMPDLPTAYSSDFSGQVVRPDACGACLTGIELTVTGENLVDGRITIVGPDLDSGVSGQHPYAILVEVSGRDMQPDFEPVLERQIETMVNDTDGVVHRGQRTTTTLNIAQKAIDKGLRLRHLGEILHARYHNEYGNILSRVQITIFTEPAQIQALTERAQAIYDQRDQRVSSLTDEDVDVFYTCNLCQSIAGGHLCVISPEHPGVCGAVDWMDARAAVSIRPVGPNKMVQKNGLIDARLGQWESVNQIAQQESGGTLAAYSLYSMMQDPGSSCGDFECITAMLPMSNGVMVVARTYEGLTPSGMEWTMLYEMVGAGVPVPGFIGHSKRILHSRKFISAEGGWQRIVWMNHDLREELRPALDALAIEAGISGFVDMIATEETGLTEDNILAHMETVAHPALTLEPMI